jgi:two-component system, chemotaxis family, protein-glutamate methylesterase/glutaminase
MAGEASSNSLPRIHRKDSPRNCRTGDTLLGEGVADRGEESVTNRDIVVIGGSAGAVRPLGELLAALPPDFPAAISVVLHLSPLTGEWLSGHLQKFTPLPVHSPGTSLEIKPGRVLVARPDHHLILQRERAIVSRGPRENMWRPAIDVLFRSAAVAHDSKVIGVLMSGELDDGTAGLQAIKACGGVVVVQDPQDAANFAMPATALTNVAIDHTVSLRDLPSLLSRLVEEDASPRPVVPEQMKREALMALAPQESVALMQEHGAPSPLSCPDCGGPLWSVGEDNARYRCLIGHAFHLNSLVQGADEAIERTLWAAIRLFEQRVNLSRMLGEQERRQGRAARAGIYEGRAQEAHEHAQRLRDLHAALSETAGEAQAKPYISDSQHSAADPQLREPQPSATRSAPN